MSTTSFVGTKLIIVRVRSDLQNYRTKNGLDPLCSKRQINISKQKSFARSHTPVGQSQGNLSHLIYLRHF